MSPCMRSLKRLYFNHRVIENFVKTILFWCSACVWVLFCHSVDYLKKSAQFSTLFCPCKYILGLKRIKLRSHSPYSPSVFISQISNKKTYIYLSQKTHILLPDYLNLLHVHHTLSGPHLGFLWLWPDQEMSGM